MSTITMTAAYERAIDIDNRTPADVIPYLEARVECLVRRIAELEAENAALTAKYAALVEYCESRLEYTL